MAAGEELEPRICGTCSAHTADKRCIKQPASPNHVDEHKIVTWSKTRDDQRCGYWTQKELVHCGDCIHWVWPLVGKVHDRQGEKPEWWQRAGNCTNYPPSAGYMDYEETYWGVTHESFACGHGEEPEIEEEEDV